MKKLTSLFFDLILTIMPISSSYGQLNYLVLANDRYCTTSECDVVLRQYTGLITAWRLSIRCFTLVAGEAGIHGKVRAYIAVHCALHLNK
jgi:hypothetical protein